MRGAALSAVVACLDVFLRVIPGAACVGHEDGGENTGHQGSGQESAQGFRPENQPDGQRDEHGHEAGKKHFAERGSGGDGYAGGVVRPVGPFQDARLLVELPAHFLDHLVGRLRHGFHGHGREEEGEHSADEQSDDHMSI